jgi:hypothetical protein
MEKETMNYNLLEKSSDLASIEKKIIQMPKGSFEGSYDHWTILNTTNHVYSWKSNALKKVEARIKGESVSFHSDKSLDEVNRHYFEKTKDYSIDQTSGIIESTFLRQKELLERVKGKEQSKELVPIGYEGTLFEYLAFDWIYHAVIHYVFYAIKNDEYDLFNEVGKYIRMNRNAAFNDFGILNLKEMMTGSERTEIFKKGYEWENDEVFILIKHVTV